jgi:hypothetical protein
MSLRTKLIFYKAFFLNTIMWGCKSIIIPAEIEYKLETFQCKAICFILNINMHQVKDVRIRNKKVRAMFGNINKVCNSAAMMRRLDFIGHTLRQEDKKLTKNLLTCWIRCTRDSGGQQSTLKDTNFTAINSLLKSNNLKVLKDCPTLSWAKEALDPSTWRALVKKKYIRLIQKTRKDDKVPSPRTTNWSKTHAPTTPLRFLPLPLIRPKLVSQQ